MCTDSFGEAAAWQDEAAKWVADFNTAVKDFGREGEGVPLLSARDTYFGVRTGRDQHVLPELYPLAKEALTHDHA